MTTTHTYETEIPVVINGLYVGDWEILIAYDYSPGAAARLHTWPGEPATDCEIDITDIRLNGWRRNDDGRNYKRGPNGKAIVYRTEPPHWFQMQADEWCAENNAFLIARAQDERQAMGDAAE